MTARTLFEWGALPFSGEGAIAETAAKRLAAAGALGSAKLKGKPPVLRFGRDELRAQGVVGVIVAGRDVLEILPKIDAGIEAGDAPAARSRLIHMLAVARDLPIAIGDRALLQLQRESLLEQLVALFAAALVDALRRGMPRRYHARQDDLPSLRGRLNVRGQFTRLAASPQALACCFDELSADTLVNQVVRAALRRLLALTGSAANERRLRELLFAYADIADIAPRSINWGCLRLGRTEERWRELINWSRLILSGDHQSTTGGGEAGWSLLFDMGALFERYLTRSFEQAVVGASLKVVAQGGMRPCLFNEGGAGTFATMPDVLVKRGDEVVLIADAKWKRLTAKVDDPKQGVSQADVYQMMAYGVLYRCRRLLLLYPHHAGLGPIAPASARYRVGAVDGLDELAVASVGLDGHGVTVACLRELVDRSIEPVEITCLNRISAV